MIIAIIVYAGIFMFGIGMLRLPSREERAVILSIVVAILLQPVALVWPSTLPGVRTAQFGLALVATVSALVLLTRAARAEPRS